MLPPGRCVWGECCTLAPGFTMLQGTVCPRCLPCGPQSPLTAVSFHKVLPDSNKRCAHSREWGLTQWPHHHAQHPDWLRKEAVCRQDTSSTKGQTLTKQPMKSSWHTEDSTHATCSHYPQASPSVAAGWWLPGADSPCCRCSCHSLGPSCHRTRALPGRCRTHPTSGRPSTSSGRHLDTDWSCLLSQAPDSEVETEVNSPSLSTESL